MDEPHEINARGIVDVYRDDAGEWRWRVKASNGNIIATSSESYKNEADAVNGAAITLDALMKAAAAVYNEVTSVLYPLFTQSVKTANEVMIALHSVGLVDDEGNFTEQVDEQQAE